MEVRLKKFLFGAIVGLSMVGGSALAQTAPSDNPATPAIASDKGDSNTSAAPVAGKNSFTETQARERLEKHGYTAVHDLALDDKSIWRGKAMKDGKTVDVALDYQGNMVGE
jgi:hypothetical protein